MSSLPFILMEQLKKLVPPSLLNETKCFVLWDDLPFTKKLFDIVMCTSRGEVIELLNRDVVLSTQLDSNTEVEEINIFRNTKQEVYYIVSAGDKLFIISRNEKLELIRRFEKVSQYTIDDNHCCGFSYLRVKCVDEGVPYIFDEDLRQIQNNQIYPASDSSDDSNSTPQELCMKLKLAAFNNSTIDKNKEDLRMLRQRVSISFYQGIQPNDKECMHDIGSKNGSATLNTKINTLWVKLCNDKVALGAMVINEGEKPIENLNILLYGCLSTSMTYVTKVFVQTEEVPYWKQKNNKKPLTSLQIFLVLVIELNEILERVPTHLGFEGAVVYRCLDNETLVPFERMPISLEHCYDVVTSGTLDKDDLMTIMATSEQNDLLFHVPRNEVIHVQSVSELLCNYLHMEKVDGSFSTIIHRSQTYKHINGIMLQFGRAQANVCMVHVHSRTQKQIYSLIHLINDVVPQRLMVTTQNFRSCNEQDINALMLEERNKINILPIARCVVNQIPLLLSHFDQCLVGMSRKNDSDTARRIGREVDVIVNGTEGLVELKNKLYEEYKKGVEKAMEHFFSGNFSLD